MKKINKNLLIFVLIILFNLKLLIFNAAFGETKNDLQSWDAIVIEAPIHGNLRGYFDLQPRIGNNITQLDTLVVRPAIGYKITPIVSLWLGFSWQPHPQPVFINEDRPYQGIIIEKYYKKFKLTFRSRIEERFIEYVHGASIRQRELIRFDYPLGKSKKWGLLASNEILFNYNSTENGPKAGFDQARFYYGISRKFNNSTHIEFGYMCNPVAQGPPFEKNRITLIRHNIMFTVNVNIGQGQQHFPFK